MMRTKISSISTKSKSVSQNDAILIKAVKLCAYLTGHSKNLTRMQRKLYSELDDVIVRWNYVKKNLALYNLAGVRNKELQYKECNKPNYATVHWVNKNFDNDSDRARFIAALKRKKTSIVTPYWKSSFNDWLIYEATLNVVGCTCIGKTKNNCVFAVNAEGVQTEGICLQALFIIPSSEFTKKELANIRQGKEYYATVVNKCASKYISSLEWWYDGMYDNKGEEDE